LGIGRLNLDFGTARLRVNSLRVGRYGSISREIAFEIYVTPCGVLLHACPIYFIIISAILAFKSRRDERIIAIDVFIR
jgi:hypothetical protein